MNSFERSFEAFLKLQQYDFEVLQSATDCAKIFQINNIPLQIELITNDQIATESQAVDMQKMLLSSIQSKTKRIQLFQYQWEFKRSIIESRLLSLMGLNQKIHGRKCKIARVDKTTASIFLNENHLQGYCTARYHFALLLADEIVAMATFSAARLLNKREVPVRSFELLRFASKKEFTVVGGLTKLLHHFQELQKMDELMTYTDIAFAGNSYFKELGFELHSIKNPMPLFLNEKGEIQQAKKNLDLPKGIQVFHLGSIKSIKKFL